MEQSEIKLPLGVTVRLSRPGAAALLTELGLPMATATLAKLAVRGGRDHRSNGPPYQVWNGRCSYSTAELIAWAEARLAAPITNTAQRKR